MAGKRTETKHKLTKDERSVNCWSRFEYSFVCYVESVNGACMRTQMEIEEYKMYLHYMRTEKKGRNDANTYMFTITFVYIALYLQLSSCELD